MVTALNITSLNEFVASHNLVLVFYTREASHFTMNSSLMLYKLAPFGKIYSCTWLNRCLVSITCRILVRFLIIVWKTSPTISGFNRFYTCRHSTCYTISSVISHLNYIKIQMSKFLSNLFLNVNVLHKLPLWKHCTFHVMTTFQAIHFFEMKGEIPIQL